MKTTLALTTVLVAAACGGGKSHPDAAIAPSAVVAAGDFTAGHPGVLGAISLATQAITAPAGPAGAVGDDPVLRRFGNELYVVNRADGNNITILDAHTHELIEQLSTGAGSNPQDVAVVGNTLYVPVFGGAGIAVLKRGSSQINHVDLSSEDPDGKPNCVSAMVVGSKLYVACELLNDTTFTPRDVGRVYVLDTASSNLVGTVKMATKNPFGVLTKLPGNDLVIPTVDFGTSTGCVEKITTSGTAASAGCVVMNSQLGAASVARVEIQEPSTMWLAVSKPDFIHANLVSVDLSNGSVATPITPVSEVVGDVAVCPDGTIAISDQAKNASGVRLYKNGAELTSAPLAVGLDTKSANALLCY